MKSINQKIIIQNHFKRENFQFINYIAKFTDVCVDREIIF